jgi:VCBS repeat-containing protein
VDPNNVGCGGGGNQPPISDPNGPYTGTTGQSVAFDGSGSSDPEGGNLSYAWDFGDGVGTGTGATPSYTYTTAGTYTVSLTVTDNGNLTDTATSTANITDPGVNQPPVADANGPYTGTTGQPVAFDGSGSSDPDGNIVSYDWNFGDGSTGTGVTPSHTYAAAGGYNVSLTVTDDAGDTDTASTTATITDQSGGGCQGITITEASFGTKGKNTELTVMGTGIKNGDFILYNAYDTVNVPLATAKGKSGKFSFKLRNPNPVPCAVRVEQPDSAICGQADVANAPADCAPQPPVAAAPVGRGDLYSTPVGVTLDVTASRLSGVLYNDFDPDGTSLAAVNLDTAGTKGTVTLNTDGSFSYTPPAPNPSDPSVGSDNATDTFTYQAQDVDGNLSGVTKVVIQMLSKQTDFKITMNYELGMHCTGFEFAYCCVLPPYNSILAQVIKPAQGDPAAAAGGNFVDGFPRLLEGDPNTGKDGLNRETVLRDWDHTKNEFKKYQLRYYHDAQPRQEGNTSKPNTSTLISNAEGNSLQYFNTVFDSAQPDGNNALVYGPYNGLQNVIQGSGVIGDVATDNYANAWLNHFYIYGNLEGLGNTGLEADKVRLGVAGQVEYPANSGAALQPLGPTGNGAFENLLTFSGDTGTVVFTQAKVLEDLPIMLTSPRIWEALGLPLTPFEDTIGFFADPGAVDEDAVRPYVAMKASLHEYPSGNEVMGSNGQPVIGFGTAPIDIPNCERCHSAPSVDPVTNNPNMNSPNFHAGAEPFPHAGPFLGIGLEDMTNLEINFWLAYYDIVPGVDSTWYPRLKGAAINMLTLHDIDQGTSFTANYAGVECSNNPDPTDPNIDPGSYACSSANGLNDLTNASNIPQNTRLGNESVICQRCHADNVIANVKAATYDPGGQSPIPPISEAIHNQHRNQSEGGVIVFNDSLGRDGGCQGCHPAHRSDGVMDNYPITLGGNNVNANGDNRLNPGGCFVGRDVHSNPMKDVDGAETPSYLTAMGSWLNGVEVAEDSGQDNGIWCTNCHSQLSQEVWKTEDCNDLIRGDCLVNPRGAESLTDLAFAIGWTEQQVIDSLDPKVNGFNRTEDLTHAVWDPANADANVATIEFSGVDCATGSPVVSFDPDGDPSVNILSFCTTNDCVNLINNNKSDQAAWRYPAKAFIDPANDIACPVPFSAATDGRDHWLAAGEPHCADCHQAPFTEQSGNFSPYPPFNYPAKASLMRYTRGHQDVSCQGCHESIHGLYPVTPAIDTTSYAQAAALNNDGSHGPLKCAACHTHVDGNQIPTWVNSLTYNDPTTPGNDNIPVAGSFDTAVKWMHTYTAEADPAQDVCSNCHGPEVPEIGEEEYLEHAMVNRVSRVAMDNAERSVNNGQVFGETAGAQREALCSNCHNNGTRRAPNNCNQVWIRHLIEGRVSETPWEDESAIAGLGTCGW